MRKLFALALLFAGIATASAQNFDDHFADQTLRIDYTFIGNSHEQHVALREMSKHDNWWGRRVNLDEVPLQGNGDLTIYDATRRMS